MVQVSICIPTCDCKDYLRLALASVYRQTFKDYEIVIVDDGSTDGTEEMLERTGYSGCYYRFDHRGQQAMRNELIQLAQGEYLTFLDSDDEFFPYSLEVLMGIIQENGPETFAFGTYTAIDEQGRELPRRRPKIPTPFTTADLFEYIHVQTCGTLFARRHYARSGGFDANRIRCDVYRLLLELSTKHSFVGVDVPVFRRRRHRGNVAPTSSEDWLCELEVLQTFYDCHGKGVISEETARKRLSREQYRVAKAFEREHNRASARAYFRRSYETRPNLKSFLKQLIV